MAGAYNTGSACQGHVNDWFKAFTILKLKITRVLILLHITEVHLDLIIKMQTTSQFVINEIIR